MVARSVEVGRFSGTATSVRGKTNLFTLPVPKGRTRLITVDHRDIHVTLNKHYYYSLTKLTMKSMRKKITKIRKKCKQILEDLLNWSLTVHLFRAGSKRSRQEMHAKVHQVNTS